MILSGDRQDLLDIAVRAVDSAGAVVRSRAPGAPRWKGDRDPASEVDVAIERTVRAFLRERTPDIGFLGEEEGSSGPATGPRWVLDPVDGTVNFLHGYPLCAVALALVEEDRTEVAAIDLPLLGMRYTAMRGGGAYVGTRRLQGGGATSLREALVSLDQFAFGPGSEQANARRKRVLEALVPQVQRVRIVGASVIDLAWTAEGRQDACVLLGNKPWDTAAGVLLAREAGVRVVDLDGADHTADSQSVVAVPPPLADRLLAALRAG